MIGEQGGNVTVLQLVRWRQIAYSFVFSTLLMSGCAPVLQRGGPIVGVPFLDQNTVTMDDGYVLPMRQWLPTGSPRAVVVAVHGFNDYSNAFTLVGPALAQREIAVFAYDQRGFGATNTRGLWPAKERAVADMLAVVGLLRQQYPKVPHYVIGDSMGAAMVIAAFSGENAPVVDGIILNAPAVWGQETFNRFYRVMLWTMAHIVPAYKVTGEGMQVTISDNREILIQMSRDPLMIRETRFDALYGLVQLMDGALAEAENLSGRVLVLYGLKDEVIPRASMCRFASRLDDSAQVMFYPNGYHLLLRDLQADRVFNDIVSWIDNGALNANTQLVSAACPSFGARAGGHT